MVTTSCRPSACGGARRSSGDLDPSRPRADPPIARPPTSTAGPIAADAVAVLVARVATVTVPELVGGAAAIVAVVVAQRIGALRPAPSAIVVGVRQSILGVAVVLCTWLGVVVAGGLP